MFGCISEEGKEPKYKVINLVVDQTSSDNDDILKPLIPDGKFVEETYNPQYLTTTYPNNVTLIQNKAEEDKYNENNKDLLDLNQRITISKSYYDSITDQKNKYMVEMSGLETVYYKTRDVYKSCIEKTNHNELNFYKLYKTNQTQAYNSPPVPQYK